MAFIVLFLSVHIFFLCYLILLVVAPKVVVAASALLVLRTVLRDR